MASGSFEFSATEKLQGKIEWSSSSNGSTNSSSVTAKLYARRLDSYTTQGQSWGGFVKIGSAQTNINFSNSVSVSSSWVLMASVSATVTHGNDGTGKVTIGGSVSGPSGTALSGHTSSGSKDVSLDTISRYANISHSVSSTGLNFAKINWSSDSTCDMVQYSINGGTWVNASGNPYTISGLSPNVTYKIRTRVRRKDSQLYSNTGELSVTTKDIARISSASNFNHGDSTTVGITNPAGGVIKLRLLVGDITIFNKNVTVGNNAINFSDTELDSIYKKYGDGSSVNATFIVDTYNGSSIGWTNTKGVIIYLKGNQKSVKENINGTYKRGKIWINVNGTWKRAVIWININDLWKRGI